MKGRCKYCDKPALKDGPLCRQHTARRRMRQLRTALQPKCADCGACVGIENQANGIPYCRGCERRRYLDGLSSAAPVRPERETEHARRDRFIDWLMKQFPEWDSPDDEEGLIG